MSRDALLGLLQDRLGLDPATLGERVIDDACADARRALAVADDDRLYRRVLLDAEAFAELAECFVVPESWFFRASEQFEDLVRFARQVPERRPLRVLSLPCASGEEAYSAAIALLEAGFAPADIDILGIDVSRLAILRAQAGVYRSNALRGQAPPSPWLHERPEGIEVDAVVRRCARFRVGNALDPLLLRAEDSFDVVFCRNLLIYLHAEGRQRLLSGLLECLATPGLILAGQAEVLTSVSTALQPYEGGSPLSFVRRPAPLAPVPAVLSPRAAPRHVAPEPVARTSPAPPPPTPRRATAADAIAEVQRLADAGHVAEARKACLGHLARHPSDIAGHYLLGLLESASGDAEAAERAFTRVLYLDRDHLDALEQRIGLAERRGQDAQARDLRARAARLRQRQEAKS